MGCDIHMRAEIEKKGKWEMVKKAFKSDYYKEGDAYFGKDEYLHSDEPYAGRNYDLFACLADVRNGRGFAGVQTGDGFNPIVSPRGIPEDASKEYKKLAKEWGVDGHSHSYLTVAELKAYDWHGQKTTHRGVVPPEQFKIFQKEGKPKEWSSDVVGGMVEKISNRLMAELVQHPLPTSLNLYTIVEWEESYYESCKHFVDVTIPMLEKLGNPNKVRIVFFFDN